MAKRRRGRRKDILDWWQAILDETKDFVDDTIDRVRDDDDDLEDEVDELKQAVAQLNAKLDKLLAASAQPSGGKPPRDVVVETPVKEGATS